METLKKKIYGGQEKKWVEKLKTTYVSTIMVYMRYLPF